MEKQMKERFQGPGGGNQQTNNHNNRRSGQSSRYIVCFHCGQQGRIIKECPNHDSPQEQQTESSGQVSEAASNPPEAADEQDVPSGSQRGN